MSTVVADLGKLRSELAEAGAPAVANGKKVANDAAALVDGFLAAYNRAKREAQNLPVGDQASFAEAASEMQIELAQASSTVLEKIQDSETKASPALGEALNREHACDRVQTASARLAAGRKARRSTIVEDDFSNDGCRTRWRSSRLRDAAGTVECVGGELTVTARTTLYNKWATVQLLHPQTNLTVDVRARPHRRAGTRWGISCGDPEGRAFLLLVGEGRYAILEIPAPNKPLETLKQGRIPRGVQLIGQADRIHGECEAPRGRSNVLSLVVNHEQLVRFGVNGFESFTSIGIGADTSDPPAAVDFDDLVVRTE